MMEVLILLLIICISKKIYKEKICYFQLIEINKMLKNELDRTQHTVNEWKKSQHDIRNHMIVIESLLRNQNYKEAAEYSKNLLEKAVNNKNIYQTGNKVVDAILNQKAFIAGEKGILFSVGGRIPDKFKIDDLDWCTLFGNAVDNAVENVSGSEKFIKVILRQECNFFLIKISNSIEGNVLLVNPKLRTTKTNKDIHGIGIKSIKNTVKKYHGKLRYNCNNHVFNLLIIFKM